MIQPPILLSDFLGANTLETLGKGEIILPGMMLNRLLSSAPLPLPLDKVNLSCQSGFFLIDIQLDLRDQGLPLRPRVQQMFELERLRLDPINQFILLKPRGGLHIDEGSVGRRRLSPVARALLTTMLHTPTLLKLVRDRFPKNVHYEHGRLHVDLSSLGPIQGLLDREVPLGHVKLKPMEFVSIKDIDIRKGKLVLLFDFKKNTLLGNLQSPAPEGFYKNPALERTRSRKMLPPPEDRVSASPGEKAFAIGKKVAGRGRSLLGRFRKGR